MSSGSHTAARAPSLVRGQFPAGIAFAATAMFFYAFMDASSKVLMGEFSPFQLLVARSGVAFAFGFALMYSQRRKLRDVFSTRQPVTQLVRGFGGTACMLFTMAALQSMPLAEVTTIVYSAPLLAGLLAIPLLGERMSRTNVLAGLVGFAGVLLIAKPDSATLSQGIPYALAALGGYAITIVATRRLGRTDSALTTHMYTQLCFLAVCVPVLPFVWVTPQGSEFGLIAAMAVAGTVAMYLITVAHQTTPAADVAPIDYTIMMWGALFGFMVWGQVPSLTSWIGLILIMGTGILTARQGRPLPRPLMRRAPASAAVPGPV